MGKKSFPTIVCLSAQSLTTNTLKMSTTGLSQKPTRMMKATAQPREVPTVRKVENEQVMPQSKLVCPYCNGYNYESATSCIHCGRAFKEREVYYCSNCGKDVDEDANVCTHCGVRLDYDEYL